MPGNHELYTLPSQKEHGARGLAKYMECVTVARSWGVLTPEGIYRNPGQNESLLTGIIDPFAVWDGDGGPCLIAPIFTLYDYSFRPADIPLEKAVDWAREKDTVATDEVLLHPDPYKSRQDWCAALVDTFDAKLETALKQNPDTPIVIINHWPLREDLVNLLMVPRFSIWCGTTKTEDWHKKFKAKVVVSGHLHVRRTDWKDGTRFEECSLGYPRQWKECLERGLDINDMLREILPGPEPPPEGEAPTYFRRYG